MSWKDQILLNEKNVPIGSHFSEHQKNTMAENVVVSVGPLSAMKCQSDQHFLRSGQELMHEKYSNLLLSAATNYDMQFSSSGSQSSRKTYITESHNSKCSLDSISDFTMHPLSLC